MCSLVARFSITPLKGAGLQHPERIELTRMGAVGDRDFFTVGEDGKVFSSHHSGAMMGLQASWDPASGRLALRDAAGAECADVVRLGPALTGDFYGFRPVPGRLVEGPWAELLSELAGRPLRLVQAAEPGDGSDVHPVTLMGSASVAALAAHAGLPEIDGRRFRMLIELDGLEPFEEDTWKGRRLRVGTAELVGGDPVLRCAATTRNPDSGDRDAPIVKLVRAMRGMVDTELGRGVPFGVFATVAREGVVCVGDRLIVS